MNGLLVAAYSLESNPVVGVRMAAGSAMYDSPSMKLSRIASINVCRYGREL